MLNNFIYAQTKDLFLEALGAGNILDEAIVFIEDTKEIWTHGHYFDCSTLDPSIIPNLQTEVAELRANTIEKSLTGELETARAQAISGGNHAYALPDTANGDEDDVLLSQQSVKTINGETIYGSGNISTFRYGVCNTAANTAAKTVTVSGNFSLVTGVQVVVKFNYGNTSNTIVTLNVNNTGAKTIEWGSCSGARYMNMGEVLTFMYDGTNWYCKSSSAALTSGNVNMGYNLQTINSNSCGLAISAGSSISSNADGALYINKGNSSGNNAIYCSGGNIVTQNGFFDGAYAYNTRVLTGSATLNKTDSLVLCNATSNVTVTLPSDPVDGQIITFINPTNKTVIFSSSISNLNAPQDGTSNSKTITITSIGVRKLYYINSRWYLFLQ